MGEILSVLNVCKTDPHYLTVKTEHGKAGTLVSSITGKLHVYFLTNNVNFSFKAAGTNAAHRLSSVPISEMGQLTLKKKNEGRNGQSALFDKNNVSNVFPLHKGTGTFRKTKHPSHLLQPVP